MNNRGDAVVDLHPIDFAEFAHACGGVGFTAEDPGECSRALNEFLNAPGPAILQAVVDPLEPPLPAKVKAEQAVHFAEALAKGEPNRKKIALMALSDKVREFKPPCCLAHHSMLRDGGQMNTKNGLADLSRLKPVDSDDKRKLRVVIETPKGSGKATPKRKPPSITQPTIVTIGFYFHVRNTLRQTHNMTPVASQPTHFR